MGGFDPVKLKESFEISDEFEAATVIALGYPGKVEDLEPALQQRELGATPRKPLQEIAVKHN